jgi:hypothetical protein
LRITRAISPAAARSSNKHDAKSGGDAVKGSFVELQCLSITDLKGDPWPKTLRCFDHAIADVDAGDHCTACGEVPSSPTSPGCDIQEAFAWGRPYAIDRMGNRISSVLTDDVKCCAT